ncbi:MAG: DNA-binding protein [Caulobacteraceae bacterium]|nr:DNA-binding protein [Caulobacteraceae bacterium]
MALFFDVEWFEARLAERGLGRAALGAAAGVGAQAVDLVFKDQRELSAAEVAAFAEMLGVSPRELAERAGVSTPTPAAAPDEGRLARIEARLERIEALLERLTRAG